MTWTPAQTWQPLTAGTGQSNAGVWRTPDGWIVKRLVPGVDNPRHHAYWRRQPLLAESGLVATTPGLRSPHTHKVEWDEEGATIWTAAVAPAVRDPLFLAQALGRFAQAELAEPSWGARDVLRDRLDTVAQRGGWAALDAVLPDELRHVVRKLWVRRDAALAELDSLPRVPTHGDAHPGNLIGRDSDDVIAIDWEQFGLGPVGFDLGYLLLAVEVPLTELLGAYGGDDVAAVRRGAVLVAAYTGVSRAAWSINQAASGDELERIGYLGDLVVEAAR